MTYRSTISAAALILSALSSGCSGGAGSSTGPMTSSDPGTPGSGSSAPTHHPGFVGTWARVDSSPEYDKDAHLSFHADGTCQSSFVSSPGEAWPCTWVTSGPSIPSYDNPLLLSLVFPDGGWSHTTYEVSVLDGDQWIGQTNPHVFDTFVALK